MKRHDGNWSIPSVDDAIEVVSDIGSSIADGAEDMWDDIFGEEESQEPAVAVVDESEPGTSTTETEDEESEPGEKKTSTDRDPGEIIMGKEAADPVIVDATEFSACKYTSICSSSAEKALKELFNEEVASKNYTIKLGDTSIERIKGSAGVILKTKKDGDLTLNGTADFKRLLEGSGGVKQIDKAASVDELLEKAVNVYYKEHMPTEQNKDGKNERGGIANAENKRGSGSFNFNIIRQALNDEHVVDLEEILITYKYDFKTKTFKVPIDEDSMDFQRYQRSKYLLDYAEPTTGKVRGIECAASSTFNMFKSMGLIPPNLSRLEIEQTYTQIHGKQDGEAVLPITQNTALRMAAPGVDKNRAMEWLEVVKKSDWAKLTGMNKKSYFSKTFDDTTDVEKYLEQRAGLVRASEYIKEKGNWVLNHFVTLTDIKDGKAIFDETLSNVKDESEINNKSNGVYYNDFWAIGVKKDENKKINIIYYCYCAIC